jgi:hypothetical protein
VKRRPQLLDGILLPRLYRSAASPTLILVPDRHHTRLRKNEEFSPRWDIVE